MKTMISDFKPNQHVRTFLGLASVTQRKAKNQKGYLVCELYDVGGTITGYIFGEIAIADKLKSQRYVEASGRVKLLNRKLILQVSHIRPASADEFDVSEVFKVPSRAELARIRKFLYPNASKAYRL